MAQRCFACGKVLPKTKKMADTHDNQIVWVGPDCYQKILAAGNAGYLPRRYLQQGKWLPSGPNTMLLYPVKQVSDDEANDYIEKLAAADLDAGIE